MKRFLLNVALFLLMVNLIVFTAEAAGKKYRNPPTENQIEEKNLIIGQFIIYMPKLTTDNMKVAKETMSDKQHLYYKSEFLNGEWVGMEDVSELYHLMISDPTKVVPKSQISGFEFIAQIDKDGNLIKFAGYDEFVDSLTSEKPEGDLNEIAETAFDQLAGAENQNVLNALSNMSAESKSLEDKGAELTKLYDKTKDSRILSVIKQLEKEVAEEGQNPDDTLKDDGGLQILIEELSSDVNLDEKGKELLDELKEVVNVEDKVEKLQELYDKTKDDRVLAIANKLKEITDIKGVPDDGGLGDLIKTLSGIQMSVEESDILAKLKEIAKDKSTAEEKLKALYIETNDSRIGAVIDNLASLKETDPIPEIPYPNVGGTYDNAIKRFVDDLNKKEKLSDEDISLIKELEKINGVPQAVKESRLLSLQLQNARENGDTNQERALMQALGMETYDKSEDMKIIADDLANQGLDDLANRASDGLAVEDQQAIDRDIKNELNKAIAAALLMLPKEEQNKVTDAAVLAEMAVNAGKNNDLLNNMVKGSLKSLKVAGEKMAAEKSNLEKLVKDKNLEADLQAKQLEVLLPKDGTEIGKDKKDEISNAVSKLGEINGDIAILNNSIQQNKDNAKVMKDTIENIAKDVQSDNLIQIKSAYDNIYNNVSVDYTFDIVEMMVKRYMFIEEYKVERERKHVDSMSSLKSKIEELDYKINGILDLKAVDEYYVDLRYNLRVCEIINDSAAQKEYEKKIYEYEQTVGSKESNNQKILEEARKILMN